MLVTPVNEKMDIPFGRFSTHTRYLAFRITVSHGYLFIYCTIDVHTDS